jgi:signal transduction histidine kinase
MTIPDVRAIRRSVPNRGALFFAVVIVLPAIVLAGLAVFVFYRDRIGEQRELADRLNASAERAADGLVRELDQWAHVLDGLVPGKPARTGLSPRFEDALKAGGGVLLWKTGEDVNWEPTGGVLYALDPPRERFDGRASGLPASLIVDYGRCHVLETRGDKETVAKCGLDFYARLLDGRWSLERLRFNYYKETARSWAAQSQAAASDLRRLDAAARARTGLTEAVEAFLASWPDGVENGQPRRRVIVGDKKIALAFWQAGTGSERAALVLGPEYVRTSVFARAFVGTRKLGLEVLVRGARGEPLWSTSRSGPPSGASVGAHALIDSTLSWRIQLWPRDLAAWRGDVRFRRRLQVAMLFLVLASVGFASAVAVRTLRRELEVARLKSEFVAAVTHEFRSPLAGIRQLADLLEQGRVPSDGRRQQYYGMIVRESDRLERLVENVLNLSRIDEGQRPFRFELVDSTAWLGDVVAEFTHVHLGAGPALDASIAADLPRVRGDREALSVALNNLLDNAVKYSPGQPTVWLTARSENHELVIEVRDSGAGIDPEDQRHVFDRFYRGRREITRRVKGTGPGLSLVRQIVEAHEGEVSFTSHVGEGSRFTIRLAAVR